MHLAPFGLMRAVRHREVDWPRVKCLETSSLGTGWREYYKELSGPSSRQSRQRQVSLTSIAGLQGVALPSRRQPVHRGWPPSPEGEGQRRHTALRATNLLCAALV